MRKRVSISTITIVFLFMFNIGSHAAEVVPEIHKTSDPPVIDGKLDDNVWTKATTFTGFKTFQPDYGKTPHGETIVFVTYDKDNFYFGIRCLDINPKLIKATITKRDNIFNDDWIGIVIDTFNDKQRAYGFFMNGLGIQGDGIVNIQGNLQGTHDMVWYSKGLMNDKGYTAECRIPFKSIRFPSRKRIKMGLGFFRQVVRHSETSSFPPISDKKGTLLTQTQPVIISGIKYKRVIEILPAFTHQKRSGQENGVFNSKRGISELSLTTKIGLTSEMTMDATINPDFNQVEADAGQVDVNLRYDIFYEEKRPFFLEGNEEFQFAGNTEGAPLWAVVHTRNIVDPIVGIKITGKFGWRNSIAAISAIDELPDTEIEKNAGFSIFRFRHAIKNDTYIGALYTNRSFNGESNSVAGIDGRFRISPISVTEFHLIGSTTNDGENDELKGHAMALRYNIHNRNFNIDIGIQDISENFRIDSGFLTRQNITRYALFGMYSFYPNSKFFQKIQPFYWSFHIKDKESGMFETFNMFTLRFHMPGQTMFRIDSILSNEVFENRRFNTSGIGFNFFSQPSKYMVISIFYRYNNKIYYDTDNPYQGYGHRASFFVEILPSEKLRSSFSLSYSDFYEKINRERVYDYTLVRNRTTFQLNKYLFIRAITEYNLFKKKLNLDLLTSFTYIPGTVIHLGYGTIFEKLEWDQREYVSTDRFLEMKRGLFFKISYLLRL